MKTHHSPDAWNVGLRALRALFHVKQTANEPRISFQSDRGHRGRPTRGRLAPFQCAVQVDRGPRWRVRVAERSEARALSVIVPSEREGLRANIALSNIGLAIASGVHYKPGFH
jgi:hypothetical protein